ncbi:hypothetical protein [Candidatus Nitrospira inopinata]|uniref:Uncharacterized protein n=1 Tax=Candidatus Nitrospira inopinata TaxID=1715989 RepID=A0A0S4KWA7_9BACT|nr:hypothetical protein [Candidatus Nitrospira inopinata]CUQ66790.1 conserved protein of unknown function [Candidatus Nitrospira inopinata]
MGLLQRLRHDLRAGIAKLRLGTAHAAGRALEETERLRLRLEIRKVDQQLADLYKEVGERAVEMKERGIAVEQIAHDADIIRLVQNVQTLKETRKKLEDEMQDIKSEA